MSVLLILLSTLVSFSAQADLEKIFVKNLNLDYAIPYGKGELEKLGFGVSLKKSHTYPVEVFRRDDAFEVLSHFIDFEWKNPLPFAHNIKSLKVEKLDLKLDQKQHYLRGNEISFLTPQDVLFFFHRYDLECNGTSVQKDPLLRLMEDCRQKLRASIDYTDIPTDVYTRLSDELPAYEADPTMEIPASDLFLSVDEGDVYASMRVKYVIRAYLRFWGHTQYQDGGKTLALRVDQIKFGIVPVTKLVMEFLQRQISHPDIQIDPPWIRIKLGQK